MTLCQPILVGESNPYSSDPSDALLPYPTQSAGARLCRMLGVRRGAYLELFYRANLCVGSKWSVPRAREAADVILATLVNGEPVHVIMLGAKVAAAFGQSDLAVWSVRGRFTRIPHPSGLSREWNKPGAVDRLRWVMRPWLDTVSA